MDVVAQVHRQQGDKEEEEEKGEEVLEQEEELDQSTRPQLSTSQAVLTTPAGTAESVTTPAPIRQSGRKVTPTQRKCRHSTNYSNRW